jgi:hypothetical protein
MAEHPDDVHAFGEGARRTVMERYATSKMIDKITNAYERLIAEATYR